MNTARLFDSKVHLTDLLKDWVDLPQGVDASLNGITLDSRKVRSGDLFIACKGANHDARDYISNAIEKGAAAVLVEAGKTAGKVVLQNSVPLVPVTSLRPRVCQIAARFHGYPARQLWLIGITGTNGKTSTTQFVAQLYQLLGQTCAVSGTLGSGLYTDQVKADAHAPGTTPDAVSLQALYADVVRKQAGVMVMEVSSHGLDQYRVDPNELSVAVFTNLSRDHLDYHRTMKAYGEAKLRLFSGAELKIAVVNLDDEYASTIIAGLGASVQLCTYSLSRPDATVYLRQLEHRVDGSRMELVTPWGEARLDTSLLGSFNVSNLLAALSVVLTSESLKPDFDFAAIVNQTTELQPVNGRMEVVSDSKPVVVVDYAHSPDGLSTALRALREHFSGQVWCVFGCGGNRDSGKRPQMAEVVEELADHAVVTDDNPRYEDSSSIIADILKGFGKEAQVTVRPDRAAAIALAIEKAGDDDVVLIAGKGHEDYQEVRGNRHPFSDVAQARLNLQKRRKGRKGGGS